MTLNELAHQIAAEWAASIIESYGVRVKDSRGHVLWYAVDVNDPYGGEDVSRALTYLRAMKMLRRHPRFAHHVKVRWAR